MLSAALLVPLAALTACGAGSGAQSSGQVSAVAALPSTAAPSSPAAGASPATGAASGAPDPGSTADRPQERLDDTNARDAQLWGSYFACLGANGVPLTGGISYPGQPSYKQPAADAVIPQAAKTACLPKMPVVPPQTDPKQNPNFSADFSAWVNCINNKGLKVKAYGTAGSGNSGWSYDGTPTMPKAQQDQVISACKVEAFNGSGH
ncbi:hypothetical protein [Kitasatospora sp. MAP5-34]|uniref:hypothetical protein n=1 Tax=Kitasatospora sp. MAP5-34 TaxID=3035102 RepID=UPI0024736BC7|nr:hypothetical protein [Kitasatospora sp. MAP5-34]MDH6577473.1 hypothetical protein [Kitasatospora sp. MAP5-34]